MVRSLLIIFGCLAIGEAIVHLTGIKFPSSIIGMLLLTFLLKSKHIKVEWIKQTAEFLNANLAFFFIPPGVALMLYFDLIESQFLPILVASLASTLLVLAATGWIHQITRRGK